MKSKVNRFILVFLSCFLLMGQSVSLAASGKLSDQFFEPNYFNSKLDSAYWDKFFDQDILEKIRLIDGNGKDVFDYSLYEDTAYVYLLAVGITAMLYFSPNEVSQWDDEDKDLSLMKLSGRYWENVSNGPVVDNDKFIINYLGHPYFGSVYYVRARHEKKTPQQSLAFSFFMSTFVYEHGIEAFFEKPSIQDMIITPLFGAILGEFSLSLEKEILSDNRKLFYSRTLGELCLFLIDPIRDIVGPMKMFLGDELKLRVRSEFTWINPDFNDGYHFQDNDEAEKESVCGVKFVFYRAVQ